MSVNKVILLGRLGQDPELKYTASGMAVCNFSLATSENWNDKSGQKQERTEWHRVVVWAKLGEICNQYLSKGRQAFVEGRLQTRSWDDKTGQKRYTTEIVATNVQFIGGQAEAGYSNQRAQTQTQTQPQSQNGGTAGGAINEEYDVSTDSNFTADDIPF